MSATFDFMGEEPMTAIERLDMTNLPISKDVAQRLFGQAVWAWYREHADDVILKKGIRFFSLTVRVRDLRFLFERIAGAEVF